MIHVDVYTAAYLLKVSQPALYNSIHRGAFPAFYDGKRYWVPLAAVAERLNVTEREIIERIRGEEKLSALDINTDFNIRSS